MKTTVIQLANLIDGVIEGDANVAINGVASINDACHGDVVMADNLRFLEKALESDCSCVIAQKNGKSFAGGINKAIIRVDNPSDAFIKVLKLFGGEEYIHSNGIASTAVLEDGVLLGKDVTLGANCFVGRNTVIGDGVVLFPNVYVGENVVIGNAAKIYPNVSIYANCKIGQNVIIHSGAVVGADGFGYKACGVQGLVKYPHIGTVEVGDNVEIGANTTIDRAKTGSTVIGAGTKIDNMVHIAHNVKVGRNCVIVALTGIAGSVEIGDGVTLAAQSGVKDHIKIESGSVVAARAGVTSNVASGTIVSGFPARDHSGEKRIEAARLHLPELMQRVKALEKEIERLKENS